MQCKAHVFGIWDISIIAMHKTTTKRGQDVFTLRQDAFVAIAQVYQGASNCCVCPLRVKRQTSLIKMKFKWRNAKIITVISPSASSSIAVKPASDEGQQFPIHLVPTHLISIVLKCALNEIHFSVSSLNRCFGRECGLKKTFSWLRKTLVLYTKSNLASHSLFVYLHIFAVTLFYLHVHFHFIFYQFLCVCDNW